MAAALQGHADAVLLLIEYGATLVSISFLFGLLLCLKTQTSLAGAHALVYASIGGHEKVVSMLLNAGFPPDLPTVV